jgi:hypothetical protein
MYPHNLTEEPLGVHTFRRYGDVPESINGVTAKDADKQQSNSPHSNENSQDLSGNEHEAGGEKLPVERNNWQLDDSKADAIEDLADERS